VVIGGYFIGGYCGLLLAIILMVIGGYFRLNYHRILMAIGGYYINDN